MRELWKKIIAAHEMLDAIRIRKDKGTECHVEVLKEDLGISRTTADKLCDKLTEDEDGGPIVKRENRRLTIQGGTIFFLGISIGSAHIRVVLLDLSFEAVTRDYISDELGAVGLEDKRKLNYNEDESNPTSYAYDIPGEPGQRFEAIQDRVSMIVSIFLKLASGETGKAYPLAGIGFAVAGPVDYDAAVWRSAPRIPSVRDITILDLIGYENQRLVDQLGLFLSIDNNAKAAVVSEYQNLLEKHQGCYTEDVALIYIGSGVGSAAVIGQKLLRGSHNLSGELGHIRLLLEAAGGGLSSTKTIEDLLVPEKEPEGEDATERYIRQIPYVLNAVNCILGIDRFILVGHSVSKCKDLIPALMANRLKFTVASTLQYCKAEDRRWEFSETAERRGEPSTAAIGAAMEAYFSMCRCDAEGKDKRRVNLAGEIAWRPVKGS